MRENLIVCAMGCMRGVRNAVTAMFLRRERSTKREAAPVLCEWDAEEAAKSTGVFVIAEEEDEVMRNPAWGWTVYHDAETGVRLACERVGVSKTKAI